MDASQIIFQIIYKKSTVGHDLEYYKIYFLILSINPLSATTLQGIIWYHIFQIQRKNLLQAHFRRVNTQ